MHREVEVIDTVHCGRKEEQMALTTFPKGRQLARLFDPFEEMYREMNRFWNEPRLGMPLLGTRRAGEVSAWTPMVDVFERGNQLIVKTDLPGMKKDEIEISVVDGDLVIQGERKEEKEVKEDDFYRMERAYGSFYRRLPLPFECDARKIQAHFDNGVLQVEIPKPLELKAQPEKIKII
jgi:HSP20 family protein